MLSARLWPPSTTIWMFRKFPSDRQHFCISHKPNISVCLPQCSFPALHPIQPTLQNIPQFIIYEWICNWTSISNQISVHFTTHQWYILGNYIYTVPKVYSMDITDEQLFYFAFQNLPDTEMEYIDTFSIYSREKNQPRISDKRWLQSS